MLKKIIILFIIITLTGCATNATTITKDQNKIQVCHKASNQEISALFDRWNKSLQTGDPAKVVDNYAKRSILLPTVSNVPRFSRAEKEDYFKHFLENSPVGKIDLRYIEIDCNSAIDAGLYSFTFSKTGKSIHGRYSFTYLWNGENWLITSHHSSLMPEVTTTSSH